MSVIGFGRLSPPALRPISANLFACHTRSHSKALMLFSDMSANLPLGKSLHLGPEKGLCPLAFFSDAIITLLTGRKDHNSLEISCIKMAPEP